MVDFQQLMDIFSIPRPNGSAAESQTCLAITRWLERNGISYHLHTFRIYPYFFICIGAWLIFSRSLLALSVWFRWGWLSFVIAIIGLLGGLLDVSINIPLVTWPGARTGRNILIEFGPHEPLQEIVISAHYDSKTELLDHRQRMFFLKNLRLGIILTVLLGIIGWLNPPTGTPLGSMVYVVGVIFSIPLLVLAWGLGINLSLGGLRSPSQGAVDNGAACAILFGLAHHLASGDLKLNKTHATIALFTGEEVNMQGSRAYVNSRDWPFPAIAVNLEVLAQDGEYIYWEQDGNSLKLVPTSPMVNQLLIQAIHEVTGAAPIPKGPVNSDGSSFLFAGIPTGVFGTYDKILGDRGFHSPLDNLNRVVMERLPEGVKILERLLMLYDSRPTDFLSTIS